MCLSSFVLYHMKIWVLGGIVSCTVACQTWQEVVETWEVGSWMSLDSVRCPLVTLVIKHLRFGLVWYNPVGRKTRVFFFTTDIFRSSCPAGFCKRHWGGLKIMETLSSFAGNVPMFTLLTFDMEYFIISLTMCEVMTFCHLF